MPAGSNSARTPRAADAFSLVVEPGDHVFREGDQPGDLYLIEEGRIELTGGAPARVRTVLEAGDFFGEAGPGDTRPREMSARALTWCRLLRLDRVTFAGLVRESPDIALAMLARAAGAHRAAAGEGVLTHEPTGTEFVLRAERHGIGRNSQARGVQPDVDLSSMDPEKSLSRRHARIVRKADGYYLVQEDGRNGTFVNDRRLEPDEEVRVTSGDRLIFGLVETVFRMR